MAPHRRTLLAVAGSALAGLAGCSGISGSDPSDETPDSTPDGTPTETPIESSGNRSERSDESPENTASGTSAEVDLSTASYLAGAAPAEESVFQRAENTPRPLSEFPEAFADAVREARDGGFETDDPGRELLAAVDDRTIPRTNHRWSEPVVRLEGTAYVVEPQLPVLEVRLGGEILDEYDRDRTVSYEDEFENGEIESLIETISWNGTPNTARGSYNRSLVPDEVEAFLDSYDYVEDERGVSAIVVERHNWEPPYAIELREFTEEDRWGREVLDAGSLDDDLRTFLDAVIESGRGISSPPFVADDVPDTYFETLEPDSENAERPLVRVDGTVYRVNVIEGTHESMPITLRAEQASPTDDGLARFTLTAEVNDDKPGAEVASGEPVELYSAVGLPSALWIAHDGENHLLKSDRYEVEVASEGDGGSWSLDVDDPVPGEMVVSEELSVGDELTATYAVPATVPSGQYTLAGNVAALWRESPDDRNRTDGNYPFRIELTLSEA